MTATPCHGSRHSDITLSGHQLVTTWREPRRCVTARVVGAQAAFTLESCSDDTPEQRWEMR
jgi:hypothetical protein